MPRARLGLVAFLNAKQAIQSQPVGATARAVGFRPVLRVVVVFRRRVRLISLPSRQDDVAEPGPGLTGQDMHPPRLAAVAARCARRGGEHPLDKLPRHGAVEIATDRRPALQGFKDAAVDGCTSRPGDGIRQGAAHAPRP